MSNVHKTDQYEMFKKHENNRELDRRNLQKIIFSIKSLNMLQFRPILVDSAFRVLDGQHRLEAAKSLGVEVYYQIKEESHSEDIVLLNANQKPWRTQEYVEYYASKGVESYVKLLAFSKKVGLPIEKLTRFLKGDREERETSLKAGTLSYFTQEREAEILQLFDNKRTVIEKLALYLLPLPSYIGSSTFTYGLLHFLQNPDVNFSIFLNKIALKVNAIRRCTDKMSYYQMFKDIYNYKNQNPID